MFKLLTFRSEGAFWPLADPADSSHASRFIALLAAARRATAAIRSAMAARRAMQALAGLDDRMLRDIGIERSQIKWACRHGRDAALHSSDLRADIARWS
jgi:uncharacterized protein YjiS (DUF1127 family)